MVLLLLEGLDGEVEEVRKQLSHAAQKNQNFRVVFGDLDIAAVRGLLLVRVHQHDLGGVVVENLTDEFARLAVVLEEERNGLIDEFHESLLDVGELSVKTLKDSAGEQRTGYHDAEFLNIGGLPKSGVEEDAVNEVEELNLQDVVAVVGGEMQAHQDIVEVQLHKLQAYLGVLNSFDQCLQHIAACQIDGVRLLKLRLIHILGAHEPHQDVEDRPQV